MTAAKRLQNPVILRAEIADISEEISAETNFEALAVLEAERNQLRNQLRALVKRNRNKESRAA